MRQDIEEKEKKRATRKKIYKKLVRSILKKEIKLNLCSSLADILCKSTFKA